MWGFVKVKLQKEIKANRGCMMAIGVRQVKAQKQIRGAEN